MKPSDKLTMVSTADRLEEAAYMLRRLPKVTVQGCKSNWPQTVNEFHECYGYNEATVHLGPPSARHIAEIDKALLWFNLLDPHLDYTRRLVWLRANRIRWKRIEPRFGHSRTKLHNDYRNALMAIPMVDCPIFFTN